MKTIEAYLTIVNDYCREYEEAIRSVCSIRRVNEVYNERHERDKRLYMLEAMHARNALTAMGCKVSTCKHLWRL